MTTYLLQTAALLLLHRCAPTVAPATMSAVIAQESSWKPYAIRDNTARRSEYPKTERQAIIRAAQLTCVPLRDATGRQLVSVGPNCAPHVIDAGYAGVDSVNWAHYGLTPVNVFDQCLNVRVGADILTRDYISARRNYPPTEALGQALQAYNSGRFDGAPDYASGVIVKARATLVALPPMPEQALPPNGSYRQAPAAPVLPPKRATVRVKQVAIKRPAAYIDLAAYFHPTPQPRRQQTRRTPH